MKNYSIKAVPFDHPQLNNWRNSFVGKQYFHQETNLLVFGAVDGIWINPVGEIHIVDYKSTSNQGEISWTINTNKCLKSKLRFISGFFAKADLKFLQRLIFLRHRRQKPAKFNGRLDFELFIIKYKGDDFWVEPLCLKLKIVYSLRECLFKSKIANIVILLKK
ncbi:MAG: hypothetical protein ABIK90_07745 [candidate division WOR-3 bacterium]